MSTQQRNRVWLITGCSTGFGRAFIPAILARGDKVVATARRIESIQDLQQENVRIMQLDVTASQAILNDKFVEASSFFGGCDVLVNNAGIVVVGVWEELTDEKLLDQYRTNVFGAINVTRASLPHFRRQKSGVILFMSSISAWKASAGNGPYGSSKSALEGAVEYLDQEVSRLGIRSHILILGQFTTNILSNANRGFARASLISDYDEILDGITTRFKNTDRKQPGDTNLAVERIVDIVTREGSMKDKQTLPLRIALGTDAFNIVRSKCLEMLKGLEEFEEISKSTDVVGRQTAPAYG